MPKVFKGNVFMPPHSLTSASQCTVGSSAIYFWSMLSTSIAWLCIYNHFFFQAQIHAASAWGRMHANWLTHVQVCTITLKISTLGYTKLIAGLWGATIPFVLLLYLSYMHARTDATCSMSFVWRASQQNWRSPAWWRLASFPGSLLYYGR